MKRKKLLNILIIGLISYIIFPFNINAKSISSLDVSDNNNKFNISGKTEDGVLAVATLVYSNNKLLHMESCSVTNNKYSCTLDKTFSAGEYVIKVADYNGGNYITKNKTIAKINSEKNPKTYDSILLYLGLGIISIIGLSTTGVYIKKKIFKINVC